MYEIVNKSSMRFVLSVRVAQITDLRLLAQDCLGRWCCRAVNAPPIANNGSRLVVVPKILHKKLVTETIKNK